MLYKRAIREEMVEKALTSPASRRILHACIRQPRSVKEISEHAKIPLASAYRQVKALVDDGLLVVERSAMTTDGKAYDLYRSRVTRAMLELEPGGLHVTWEPNAAIEDRLMHMWERLGE